VNLATLQARQQKHPSAASHCRPPCDQAGHQRFDVYKEHVLRALRSFPLGSSGGPDELTPQHISDLLAGASAVSSGRPRQRATGCVLLQKDQHHSLRWAFNCHHQDGGIRPIAVGYTLRRLAAKCANNYVIKRRSEAVRSQQIAVGVSSGVEAAVHEARRLVVNQPHHHVVVKLDFSNAFNNVRSDHTQEIYRLVFSLPVHL